MFFQHSCHSYLRLGYETDILLLYYLFSLSLSLSLSFCLSLPLILFHSLPASQAGILRLFAKGIAAKTIGQEEIVSRNSDYSTRWLAMK
jgi:hypothetical protein